MTTFAGHFLGPDTHANRPSVTGLPNGTQYFCTTHSKVERVVSGAWADYFSVGGTETLGATIFDAKGDVLVGSANDAGAALAVGTNGQVLTADSAQTLGVKWATPSAGAAGALTLLHTLNLGSAGTFDQASISGAYNDLVCVLICRSAGSAGNNYFKFNNDSGANYTSERYTVSGNAAISASESAATGSGVVGGYTVASSDPAGCVGVTEMIIFGYASTSWIKAVRWTSFQARNVGAGWVGLSSGGGLWNNTAAINRVQANATGGNFDTASQLRIYGRL